jgi:hypothetical protein
LRAGIRFLQRKEPFSLAAVAKKAPNIGIAVSEQARDNLRPEETACACNQNFQARTSG